MVIKKSGKVSRKMAKVITRTDHNRKKMKVAGKRVNDIHMTLPEFHRAQKAEAVVRKAKKKDIVSKIVKARLAAWTAKADANIENVFYDFRVAIELILPWGPSINDYYVSGARNKPLTKAARAHRSAIVTWLQPHARKTMWYKKLIVEITMFPPTRADCDLDNYLKPLLDAMEHSGVYEDDNMIDRLVVDRGINVKHGCVKVAIYETRKGLRLCQKI